MQRGVSCGICRLAHHGSRPPRHGSSLIACCTSAGADAKGHPVDACRSARSGPTRREQTIHLYTEQRRRARRANEFRHGTCVIVTVAPVPPALQSQPSSRRAAHALGAGDKTSQIHASRTVPKREELKATTCTYERRSHAQFRANVTDSSTHHTWSPQCRTGSGPPTHGN